MEERKSSSLRVFIILAFLLQGLYMALLVLRNWNQHIPVFLGIYLAAFLLYGIAVKFTLNNRFGSIPRTSLLIFVSAVVFRLTVFWCLPTLSEDFYRYVWDGRAQVAGFHPYDYPPNAPEVKSLQDEIFPKLNHKEIRTPYPATAQNVFHLLAALSGNIFVFKFGILCFDFLLIEVLRRLLHKEKLSASLLLIYAWHTLPIVEFAGSTHLDIIGISLLMTAYLMIQNLRRSAAGAILGTAVMAKFLPIFAVPWMIRRGGVRFVLFLVMAASLLFLQFYTRDLRMLDGVHFYYSKARFNDSLFGLLYHWLGDAEPARRCGAVVVAISAIACLAKRFSFYRSLFIIYGTILLFSPVVHPWYVCWVIPFLAFHPNKAWLFFSGWVALGYLIRFLYPIGLWGQVLWLKLLIYLPFYCWLFWSFLHSHRSGAKKRRRLNSRCG